MKNLLTIILLLLWKVLSAQVYCPVYFGDLGRFYITNVNIGAINNNSTYNSNTNGYDNFTSKITALEVNKIATISIQTWETRRFAGFTDQDVLNFAVYIDYNNNGTFTDANEMVLYQTQFARVNSFFTGNFWVQGNSFGLRRMRVMAYRSNGTQYFYGDPYKIVDGCAPSRNFVISGDAEDYLVNLVTTCPAPLAPEFHPYNSLAPRIPIRTCAANTSYTWELIIKQVPGAVSYIWTAEAILNCSKQWIPIEPQVMNTYGNIARIYFTTKKVFCTEGVYLETYDLTIPPRGTVRAVMSCGDLGPPTSFQLAFGGNPCPPFSLRQMEEESSYDINQKEKILEVTNPDNNPLTIKVHSLDGKMMKSITSSNSKILVDLITSQGGIFIVDILQNQDILARKKIVLPQ